MAKRTQVPNPGKLVPPVKIQIPEPNARQLAECLGYEHCDAEFRRCILPAIEEALSHYPAVVASQQSQFTQGDTSHRTTPGTVTNLLANLKNALDRVLDQGRVDTATYHALHDQGKALKVKVENRLTELESHQKVGSPEQEALRWTMPMLRAIFERKAKSNKDNEKHTLRKFVCVALDAAGIPYPDPNKNSKRFLDYLNAELIPPPSA